MASDISATEHALYFSDPPCITVLKDKRQRARFTHRCSICGEPIPKGSLYAYYFVRDDDSIPPRAFASHQHIYCPLVDHD